MKTTLTHLTTQDNTHTFYEEGLFELDAKDVFEVAITVVKELCRGENATFRCWVYHNRIRCRVVNSTGRPRFNQDGSFTFNVTIIRGDYNYSYGRIISAHTAECVFQAAVHGERRAMAEGHEACIHGHAWDDLDNDDRTYKEAKAHIEALSIAYPGYAARIERLKHLLLRSHKDTHLDFYEIGVRPGPTNRAILDDESFAPRAAVVLGLNCKNLPSTTYG